MSTLAIQVQHVIDQDYDGATVAAKILTSTVDGASTRVVTTVPDSVSDQDAKAAHRNSLTALGYSWGNEL